MMFLRRLISGWDSDYLDDWSPRRAKHYEARTYRYLGIRPEPIFTWSRKFRPKVKSTVMKIADRRKAS